MFILVTFPISKDEFHIITLVTKKQFEENIIYFLYLLGLNKEEVTFTTREKKIMLHRESLTIHFFFTLFVNYLYNEEIFPNVKFSRIRGRQNKVKRPNTKGSLKGFNV